MTTPKQENNGGLVFSMIFAGVFLIYIGSMVGSCVRHTLLCDEKCIDKGYDEARSTSFADTCKCVRRGEVQP